MSGRKWTQNEEAVLIELFSDTKTETIADKLNRSYSAISNHANLLRLFKSPEFLSSEASGRLKKEDHRGVSYRFKSGHIPANKGKKLTEFMTAEGIEASSKTRFKKGNEPHNTRYDGAQRISKDGYIEQRVTKGKWKLLHRINWEAINGPIPMGFIIVNKDGDKKKLRPQ